MSNRWFLLMIFGLATHAFGADPTPTELTTRMSAFDAYENGFAHDVMRGPHGGVVLDDHVLIENDGPGAGWSFKGLTADDLRKGRLYAGTTEPIHRGVFARKTLTIRDPASFEAHVLLLMFPLKKVYEDQFEGPVWKDWRKSEQQPYYLIVNGRRIEGEPIPWYADAWYWVPVPPGILHTGENEIIVGCDAPEGEGYRLYLAREDEYQDGGGFWSYRGNTALVTAEQVSVEVPTQDIDRSDFERIEVGRTSARSPDGGRNWSQGKLGATGTIVGEYTVRLSLKQYEQRGRLLSGPIDLWLETDQWQTIPAPQEITNLRMIVEGETPAHTSLSWSVRFGDTPDMLSASWDDFRETGQGATGEFEPKTYKRFMQWQAQLATGDELATPRVDAVTIERTVRPRQAPAGAIGIVSIENPPHRYRSFNYRYQPTDEPRLAELLERLDAESVMRGATSDFEKINRLRNSIAAIWRNALPDPEFPEWDAIDILDRSEDPRYKSGGFCLQYSLVLIQAAQALGLTAHHVNIVTHEVPEIYFDELDQWVLVDPYPTSNGYEYALEDGRPLSILDMHRFFLKEYLFSATRSINWSAPEPWAWRPATEVGSDPQPVVMAQRPHIGEGVPFPPLHQLAGFMRQMLRDDTLGRSTPRPVSHGYGVAWPWSGFLNWYDEATPRIKQYALQSDREADFYPTLNRVGFTAVRSEDSEAVEISMFTQTPNFETFEIRIDGTEWRESPSRWTWRLRPQALSTLQMRSRNKAGHHGRLSHLQVVSHTPGLETPMNAARFH